MNKIFQGSNDYYRNRKEGPDIQLHFINGFMVQDVNMKIPSAIQLYMASIYSDEYIGEISDSDMLIGYSEDGSVWMTVKNTNGIVFTWNSRESGRKVTVMIYLLMQDSEYLLYRSNGDYFCYLVIPEDDPRNARRKIPNSHICSNYTVLDQLLRQTNSHHFKCYPDRLEE